MKVEIRRCGVSGAGGGIFRRSGWWFAAGAGSAFATLALFAVSFTGSAAPAVNITSPA